MATLLPAFFVVTTATDAITKVVQRSSQPAPLATQYFVQATNVSLARYNGLVEALPAIHLADVIY